MPLKCLRSSTWCQTRPCSLRGRCSAQSLLCSGRSSSRRPRPGSRRKRWIPSHRHIREPVGSPGYSGRRSSLSRSYAHGYWNSLHTSRRRFRTPSNRSRCRRGPAKAKASAAGGALLLKRPISTLCRAFSPAFVTGYEICSNSPRISSSGRWCRIAAVASIKCEPLGCSRHNQPADLQCIQSR